MSDHEKILEIIRLKDQTPIALDPRKTALRIIDMQRYFVSPHYPLMQTFEKLVPGVTAGYCERVNATVIPMQAADEMVGYFFSLLNEGEFTQRVQSDNYD